MNNLFIALMMQAVRTSETSVNFKVTTRRYIPKDTKLYTKSMCISYPSPRSFSGLCVCHWTQGVEGMRVQTRPKRWIFNNDKNPQQIFLQKGSKAVGPIS
jgi:hypothetical protein